MALGKITIEKILTETVDLDQLKEQIDELAAKIEKLRKTDVKQRLAEWEEMVLEPRDRQIEQMRSALDQYTKGR